MVPDRSRTLLILICAACTGARFGGHDLFTSVEHVAGLWRAEREAAASLRLGLGLLGEVKSDLEEYLAEYDALGLDNAEGHEAIGLPALNPSLTHMFPQNLLYERQDGAIYVKFRFIYKLYDSNLSIG